MRAAALALLACLAAVAARAGDASVAADLSARRAALGEQLVLSVSISGGAQSPRPPLIPDVEVYESGKSQNMSFINGRVSSSVVVTYVLIPKKPGRYKVPPIEVAGAAPTEAIEFVVDAPGAPAQAPPTPGGQRPPVPGRADGGGGRGPDVFVTATLDKTRAFVNEQATLIVRFHTAVPLLSAPQYDAPKLTGLLAENFAPEGQGTVVHAGRQYTYSELKSALFPVQAGRAQIGPAMVTVQVPSRGPGMGDDLFDRFFNMTAAEARRIQTEPLALQAESLPPGAPDDFSGVVGELRVEASLDRATVKAGEAVNMTVTVSGTGNIKSLPEPKRPDLPSARFFDSESSVKLDRIGDKVGGTKTFKTVLVPRVSGQLDIPPVTVSYFDPVKKAYARASSRPLRVAVNPGDPGAARPLNGPGSAQAPGVTEVASDIRYLKAPGGRSTLGDALASFGAGRPWHALPFAFFAVALGLELRRRIRESNPRARRAAEALGSAERTLARAEAETDRARAAALLGEAVTGYFSAVLDLPAAGLTFKSVSQKLSALRRPPASADVAKLRQVWEELDLLRYAPAGAGDAEVKRLAADLRELTGRLDKELRS